MANNCSLCGQLLCPGDKIRFKVLGTVDNPLRNNVGAFVKDLEWIPGTFRHLNCNHPDKGFFDED